MPLLSVKPNVSKLNCHKSKEKHEKVIKQTLAFQLWN